MAWDELKRTLPSNGQPANRESVFAKTLVESMR
jgi:hypothetical protein